VEVHDRRGHHRKLAAEQAGLASIPCWVRDMTDDAAFMALVLANSQSELLPLERGMHALKSGLDVKAYAASVERPRQTVSVEVCAARVASAVPHMWHEVVERARQLAELHAAASWLWPTLVGRMTQRNWTVDQARAWGRVISVSSRR
jgi:ParB-like chromosome segregation protein Spo0J